MIKTLPGILRDTTPSLPRPSRKTQSPPGKYNSVHSRSRIGAFSYLRLRIGAFPLFGDHTRAPNLTSKNKDATSAEQ